jgi:hypothetical protein
MMKAPARSIAPLDKVTIKLKTAPASGSTGGNTGATEAGFIFGLGVEGMTPFEIMLSGKAVGDRIDVPIEKGCPEEFFGHLGGTLFGPLRPIPPFTLNVTILSIEKAQDLEIIQALAKLVKGCGGGCAGGCDCG